MESNSLASVCSGKRQSNFYFHFVVHISQCVICFYDLHRVTEHFDCAKTQQKSKGYRSLRLVRCNSIGTPQHSAGGTAFHANSNQC
jgi:hypothetical protein